MLTPLAMSAHQRLNADPTWMPAAGDFPPEFPLEEMFAASHDGLESRAELRAAYWWAWTLSDARRDRTLAREGLRAVYVTSFVRRGDRLGGGCHDGRAVDLVPAGITTRRLHRWFIEHQLELYGEILDETFDPDDVGRYGHLHLSRWPCGTTNGRRDILYIDSSGEWHQAAAPMSVLVSLAAIGMLLLILLLI